VASENGLRSIAFPAVSTGVYGYPMDEAATIAVETVCAYLEAHDDIELVRFVQFNDSAFEAYAREFLRVTG
jgi:O-acetyl-ADP-ribose deacetylase (regulator of RNase III)